MATQQRVDHQKPNQIDDQISSSSYICRYDEEIFFNFTFTHRTSINIAPSIVCRLPFLSARRVNHITIRTLTHPYDDTQTIEYHKCGIRVEVITIKDKLFERCPLVLYLPICAQSHLRDTYSVQTSELTLSFIVHVPYVKVGTFYLLSSAR